MGFLLMLASNPISLFHNLYSNPVRWAQKQGPFLEQRMWAAATGHALKLEAFAQVIKSYWLLTKGFGKAKDTWTNSTIPSVLYSNKNVNWTEEESFKKLSFHFQYWWNPNFIYQSKPRNAHFSFFPPLVLFSLLESLTFPFSSNYKSWSDCVL